MGEEQKKYKEIHLNGRTYHLNKFPPVAGRSIITQYPITAIVQNRDYERNEAVMLKLMGFVEVITIDGTPQPLSTPALIDNHVRDWEDLVKLEMETLKFNCPFMEDPEFASGIFQSIGLKATDYLVGIFTDAVKRMQESA